jgi:phospholipase A1
MFKSIITFFLIIIAGIAAAAQDQKIDEQIKLEKVKEKDQASTDLIGSDSKSNFSIYQPTYFVFGQDNLKLQFSGKYRVAKNYNLYLGYTQTMLWDVYKKSSPMNDINYNPEAFYRILDNHNSFLKSIDIGFQHTSNGGDKEKSRSINRIYAKTNIVTHFGRNSILGELKLQNIYSRSSYNEDIIDYMGYWELKLTVTNLVVINTSRLDLEIRGFSGKMFGNIGKGGREFGLVYHVGSENFNPAIYLQYFSGYSESLLHYNEKTSQARLGLIFLF